jgi:hypothetical protein
MPCTRLTAILPRRDCLIDINVFGHLGLGMIRYLGIYVYLPLY